MKLRFDPAPDRTEWGKGMVEALIELSKDETARLVLHVEALPLLYPALKQVVEQLKREEDDHGTRG